MLPVVGVISILGLVSMDGLGGPHHGDVPWLAPPTKKKKKKGKKEKINFLAQA